MAKRNIEILVGLFVVLGTLALLFVALKAANLASFSAGETYALTARFDNIGGLKPRAPLRSAGVVVARITSISLDPKTFHAMLALAAESNPTKVSQAITRAIAQTMLSDLCFMIQLTDNSNQIQIAGGYDLIREELLEGGTLNKNAIPNDPEKPFVTSGIRLGSPAMTTRGFGPAEAELVGNLIADVLDNPHDEANIASVRARVAELTARFPVYR